MSAILPPRHARQRSGLELARLNRRVRARNRREIGDAILFLVAILLSVAGWIGVCALVEL